MRFVLVFFLLLAPFAAGEIDISLSGEVFNIGDSVDVSASVAPEASISGFVKFTVQCGRFSIPYFLTPLETQAGYRTQVDAPGLKVSSSMKGQCVLRAELQDEEGRVVEEALSPVFGVSDELSIVLLTENLSTLPGTSKKVEGIVRGAGNRIANADITISFDGNSYATTTFNGKFIIMLEIPPSMKTGSHDLQISADDGKQNKASIAGGVDVLAVPSSIEISVEPVEQDPGNAISYQVTITDQAGDRLNADTEVGIRAGESFLFKGAAKSGENITYDLGQYTPPGEYTIEARLHDLGAEATFVVHEIRDAAISRQGETVVVENTGNVPFEEEISIILEGGGKSYVVRKNIELEPGQIETIMLGKEVPSGSYNILLPAEELQVEGIAAGEEVLGQNVEIHDERSPWKKAGTGLGSVTGNIIGTDGVITQNPWYAPALLVSIIVLIALYYTRDIWLLLLMRKR